MLYTKELAEELKTKLSDLVLKVEDDDDWSFDVIATTQDTDRDNEVIKVNGWDTKNWEKNPVILANHYYTIENIIGKGIKFYTSNGVKRLKGTFSKSNPLWVLARNLYMEGMLKTVSVGFIPLKRNEQDYKIIEKAELLEVSFVAVPCNPNAVSLDQKVYDEAVSKGLIVEQIDEEVVDTAEVIITQLQSEIKEIKDILKAMADDKAKEKELSEEIERVKAQKELLQKINNATASALQNLKML